MLVLSRQVDEAILIGDERTAMVQLSPLDEEMLRACDDASLRDLCDRLLVALGNPVKVTLVDIRGDKVRLGIDAPKPIGVHRKEVFEAIQREKRRTPCVDARVPNHVMPPVAVLG